ncbi:MAG TPA: helix-turn-helix domain-containing protein [Anaerolineales bacterium]|jgi:predicted ArsR family transcriptional regulator|nr:helix-turn-helix domain-containing protein [Anaerolineales bacterium]
MEDTLVIDTLEQLKVFADPLRQRLLQAFCCNPATVKQTAEAMGEKPTRLYHHVDLLEQNGFLEIVETKQVRGTVEKTYQTVARKIIVDHAMVGSLEEEADESELKNIVMNTLQACLVDARDHLDEDVLLRKAQPAVVIAQAKVQMTPTQLKVFEEKLDSLLQEINALEHGDEEQTVYSFTAACFPIKRSTCC